MDEESREWALRYYDEEMSGEERIDLLKRAGQFAKERGMKGGMKVREEIARWLFVRDVEAFDACFGEFATTDLLERCTKKAYAELTEGDHSEYPPGSYIPGEVLEAAMWKCVVDELPDGKIKESVRGAMGFPERS